MVESAHAPRVPRNGRASCLTDLSMKNDVSRFWFFRCSYQMSKCSMALILALTATVAVPSRAAVTFTTNTLIDATNLTYDGQDIVIQGCTVTANGHHSFNSLSLNTGAVLT